MEPQKLVIAAGSLRLDRNPTLASLIMVESPAVSLIVCFFNFVF
jgi:hypothetical protein